MNPATRRRNLQLSPPGSILPDAVCLGTDTDLYHNDKPPAKRGYAADAEKDGKRIKLASQPPMVVLSRAIQATKHKVTPVRGCARPRRDGKLALLRRNNESIATQRAFAQPASVAAASDSDVSSPSPARCIDVNACGGPAQTRITSHCAGEKAKEDTASGSSSYAAESGSSEPKDMSSTSALSNSPEASLIAMALAQSDIARSITKTWHTCPCLHAAQGTSIECKVLSQNQGRVVFSDDILDHTSSNVKPPWHHGRRRRFLYSSIFTPDRPSRPDPNSTRIAHVVDLESEHPDFVDIKNELSSHGLSVICVASIENPSQLAKFVLAKGEVDLKRQQPAKVEYMYHCTRAGNIDDLYRCGLDQRRSRGGLYGTGVYLSKDPGKCDNYFKPRAFDSHGVRYMLRCAVICGRVKDYGSSQESSLRSEPPGYDAVTGMPNGKHEFVVYDGRFTYISHIVGYVKHFI